MTLQNVITNANLFTDETLSNSDYISAANKAISRINTESNTLFPYITDVSTDYTSLPEIWFLDLLSPYMAYTIKMNDSSTTEADRYLDEFYKALSNFTDRLGSLVDKYENGDTTNGINTTLIDEDGFGGIYGIDTENSIDLGYFGSQGNGGDY